tara:strand:+ start:641 stop:919 length:279 start_codon:yes stop_codon:yes gene_type:complete
MDVMLFEAALAFVLALLGLLFLVERVDVFFVVVFVVLIFFEKILLPPRQGKLGNSQSEFLTNIHNYWALIRERPSLLKINLSILCFLIKNNF